MTADSLPLDDHHLSHPHIVCSHTIIVLCRELPSRGYKNTPVYVFYFLRSATNT